MINNENWTQFNITNVGQWTDVKKIIPGSAGNKAKIRYWLDNGNSDIGVLDDISLHCEIEERPNEVPEFTTAGFLIILLAAGVYLRRKKKF